MSSQTPAGGAGPHLDLEKLVHHAALPETRFSIAADRSLTKVGHAVSWIWVVLVAVVTVNVIMRYVLGKGLIQFEELQWHLFAIGFMLGLAWVTVRDDDVRIDVLSEKWGLERRAWIEFYGMVLFFFPLLAVFLIFSVPYIAYSYSIHEVSEAPGGLPFRWAIKSVILVAFVLLTIAAVARFSRVLSYLFGAPRAVSQPEPRR